MSEDTRHPAADLTDAERTQYNSLRSRSALNKRWSKLSTEERREATQGMRDARQAKLLATVDPEGRMPVEEREARARQLHLSQQQAASAASVRARQAKAAARKTGR